MRRSRNGIGDPQTADRERLFWRDRSAPQWAAGGDPELDAREDMTLQDWRRRVAKRWWNTKVEGADEKDLRFLCLTADYITTFTAAQIAGALSISTAKATKGLNRAADLRDNVCPAMTASDAEQENV